MSCHLPVSQFLTLMCTAPMPMALCSVFQRFAKGHQNLKNRPPFSTKGVSRHTDSSSQLLTLMRLLTDCTPLTARAIEPARSRAAKSGAVPSRVT